MGRKSAQRMRTKQTRKLSAQSITTYMKTKHSVKYQSANVGGINVFYREAGDPANPAIVLLHGFPSSSHMFRGLIEELKDEFYLIAPDYPGFGFSDAPNIAQFEYTLFPQWQEYFRANQPKTLITWGKNDPFFTEAGARAYLQDIPKAELHLLDTGHFALEDQGSEIARLVQEFRLSAVFCG